MHQLQALEGVKLLDSGKPPGNKLKLAAASDGLPEVMDLLKNQGAFLLTLAGVDEREVEGSFGVYFEFFLPEYPMGVQVKISLSGEEPHYPSITPVFPSAHWLERELKDMLGITPFGHPDLRRVAVHPDWPEGVYALRRDFDPSSEVPRVPGEMEFCKVEGEGLYQIPVGPVHAGIIEPGHFRFFAFGEDMINLQAQLFYTHRGVEKAAEGKGVMEAALVAERVLRCMFSLSCSFLCPGSGSFGRCRNSGAGGLYPHPPVGNGTAL